MLKKLMGKVKVDEYQFNLDDWILQVSFGGLVWFGAVTFLLLTISLLLWMFVEQQDPDKLKVCSWAEVFYVVIVGALAFGTIVSRRRKPEWLLRRWWRIPLVALLLIVVLGWPIFCLAVSPQCSLCSIPKHVLGPIGLQNVITASAGVASILAFLQVLWIRR